MAGRQGGAHPQPPISVMAEVYLRDGFACVYCSRWTIPTQILRLISTAFPRQFPYHPNWPKATTPRVYWDISTSIDHVHAVSTGGAWEAPGNLATACARCQYQKSNLPLSALGWAIRDGHPSWDGLTHTYDALWNALGRPAARAPPSVAARVRRLARKPVSPADTGRGAKVGPDVRRARRPA
jgi:hypothetical protein